MILKPADDHTDELAQLAAWGQSADAIVAKAAGDELRIRKAGIKGEAESAYLIDFDFNKTRNWVVIHDLRLEHAGRTAQIDHLLIGRSLECYVLESKHFHAGVKITDEGEFLRWNEFRRSYEGMPSPLEQNSRHIVVLRDLLGHLPLPTRLGFRLSPEFHSLVLVSSSARIDRPKHFDARNVIKADQLKARVMGDLDKESTLTTVRRAANLVSSDTLRDIAMMLVRQHRAVPWPLPPALRDRTTTAYAASAPAAISARRHSVAESTGGVPMAPPPSTSDSPACKKCGSHEGSILYGKYSYYFQCTRCSTNTHIQFECMPGHHPRLRKAKLQFFRDCPECGTSQLYFTNPVEMT